MTEPNSQTEKLKEERRYDPELLKKGLRCDLDQYAMLKRCSEKKDITEWNKWRQENMQVKIWLQGAQLESMLLEKANLFCANLRGANLSVTSLGHANFQCAHLEGAHLKGSYLEGAIFTSAFLQGADFSESIVDGSTIVWGCKVDRKTDFLDVSLEVARIDPGTKQLLEYNVRRQNWEEWYPKQHRLQAWMVRKFWEISDYGISTRQIIQTFFVWAVIFATVYLAWGLIDYHLVGTKDYPGIVSNLFVLEDNQQAVSDWLVPIRAIYFSIVTMTTLGFGDMYANAHGFVRGFFGHLLLALQVILGYVLLGALVTRFAVLFTAEGPAGTFAEDKKEQ